MRRARFCALQEPFDRQSLNLSMVRKSGSRSDCHTIFVEGNNNNSAVPQGGGTYRTSRPLSALALGLRLAVIANSSRGHASDARTRMALGDIAFPSKCAGYHSRSSPCSSGALGMPGGRYQHRNPGPEGRRLAPRHEIELSQEHIKNETRKKGPRRQEAGVALPLRNFAHRDQLISAKPRGTARL